MTFYQYLHPRETLITPHESIQLDPVRDITIQNKRLPTETRSERQKQKYGSPTVQNNHIGKSERSDQAENIGDGNEPNARWQPRIVGRPPGQYSVVTLADQFAGQRKITELRSTQLGQIISFIYKQKPHTTPSRANRGQ
ncbi:hypothetical protein GCM10017624_46770 [Azotobacter vinelandii]|nr:hypothetical protein GCM10017624_46770 [Azotobacter vinelandii]